MKRAASFVAAAAAIAATVGLSPHASSGADGPRSGAAAPARPAAVTAGNGQWTDTWASMPQLTEPGNMPPAPFTQSDRVFDNATLRQTVHVGPGGKRIRLRLSNAFGGADLPVTAVSVARPADGRAGVGAIVPGSSRRVTFGGQPGFDIPQGAQAVSDPLDFDVAPGSNLTVTLYLAHGQASTAITSHPGSRTTSHLLAGDHLDDADLPGATTVDHWYFLSGLEVWSRRTASATVVLGDSLSDGRGSTTNGNDRWPDRLRSRLASRPGTADIAVVNEAAGGNRVLRDGLGPNALARLDRDVLARSGVDRLIVFEGVNDIGTAGTSPADARRIADELIGAYRQIVTRAHAQGIEVYGATLTPFGGNGYDDPAGAHESARQQVNQWIRTGGGFDAVIDFDRAARDPEAPGRLRPAYDTGDHLHLNPAGYQALADAVPFALFHR
ncbi:SGNH/GDSL hydrolase family protein [Streptomyces lavenduligriseus]|uniref:SGNH/GDSL hydrolase family protein n=1 Tax=Streptomyces lavenduligriseus TaxID=67315 RepID=A0ABT0NTI8_9ACTN|nr:SGNH/GDSL hydrolase family protein [Streptomyces lavenduligriseus]MCL3994613.1 SGNH/GDSL hydrolase family protein [Streptomyces lavenduligriseus]